MANILNIDTSSNFCSVALAFDGEIVIGLESSEKMDHSVSLAPLVKQCFDYLKKEEKSLDAVSVIAGPGSYTGLRIGLSLAKGLAFGLDIPLITLSSLKVMATRAMFSFENINGDELIIPLIDAGRMEVYAGVYDCTLNLKLSEQPIILETNSFKEFSGNKLIFIGDGVNKFRDICNVMDAIWMADKLSHAKYMVPLSEKYYREKNFADVAYSTPNYLKNYKTSIPKKKL